MSRDDYISKLFIKNQDKLAQEPSTDLWSKIEGELDAPASTATTLLFPRVWMSYAAAASVLLAVFTATWYAFNGESPVNAIGLEEPLALNTATPVVVEDEAEPYEEPTKTLGDVNGNLVIEEKEEEEARAQEKRIVEAVQRRLEEEPMDEVAEVIELNDIVLTDEFVLEETNLIEPAQNNFSGFGGSGGGESEVNFYQNNQPVAPQLNYSNSLPQIANTSVNKADVEEVLQRNASRNALEKEQLNEINAEVMVTDAGRVEAKGKHASKDRSKKIQATIESTSSRRGSIVARAKKSDKIKSPMAAAHPRLRPFGFLLGRWDDDYEGEGRSYEIWTLKDRNTLVGRGYKLSNDAERVFEELFQIEFRDNQIFLVMSFEENKQRVEYMLSSFDQERFIFEQKGRSKYPDKVILQKDGLQGYSVTVANSSDFLTADQQRYLEHRNRVSNIRSIRILRHVD